MGGFCDVLANRLGGSSVKNLMGQREVEVVNGDAVVKKMRGATQGGDRSEKHPCGAKHVGDVIGSV